MIAIVAAGALLRIYATADLFLHTWDERYHALVAKHLITHPLTPTLYDRPLLPYDYRNWRANSVWLHKPPLALWLMAGGMRLFGVNEIALRLPGLLLSVLGIFLTYAIGRDLFGPRVGLLGAFFHAINGYMLQLPAGRVAVDAIDNDLVVAIELGIYLAVLYRRTGRRLLLPAIGAATGLALLTKWLPGLLVVPVWLALVWRRERPRQVALHLLAILAACAAVALPWQLYIRHQFPAETRWEAAYNFLHLFVPIEGLGGGPLWHLLRMPRFFGELIFLPVLWLFYQLLARRRAELAPLAVWIAVPYVAFSLAATKLGGYTIPAGPALFLAQALFWLWLKDLPAEPAPTLSPAATLQERPEGPAVSRIPRPLRAVALVLLVLLPARYCLERLKIQPRYDRNPAWVRAVRRLPAFIGPGRVVLFNLDRPLEAMFYTPYVAYPQLPTPGQALDLHRRGYRVVVLDDGRVPGVLRACSNVELLPHPIPPSPLDDGTGFRLPRPDGSDSPLAGTVPRP